MPGAMSRSPGPRLLPAGTRWQLLGSQEIWVFAITAGPLVIGDELESGGGRGVGVSVSAFSGGYIPVTPYQAQVYEVLGRRGGRWAGTAATASAEPSYDYLDAATNPTQALMKPLTDAGTKNPTPCDA